MVSSRQVRAMRGAAAASVATFIALMSHVLGGGEVPGIVGIAVPWVLSLPACMMISGRRLSLWRLSLSVTISQVLFHALFVLGTPATGASVVVGHTGHGSHGADMVMPAMAAPSHAATMHADPSMWVWHGIAAVLTIAVLYRGELALLRMRELAARTVGWLRVRFDVANVQPAAWRPVARAVSGAWSTASMSAGVELAPLSRRGPPLTHAV